MSKHSQSRGRSRGGRVAFAQLAPMALGAILTGVAWVYLVGAAIDFGVVAVGGEPRAWLFTVGAAIGAVVCLVLMLALVGRALRVLGFYSEYQPRRAAARRRRR